MYTTLDLTPPRTPAAESERHQRKSWLAGLTTRRGERQDDVERTALRSAEHNGATRRDELKWSRDCFVAEVKCYGKASSPLSHSTELVLTL